MRSDQHPWRDHDTLYELYVEQKLTTKEIGEKLGCSNVTISNWLKKNGIKTRDRTRKQSPWTDESTLRQMYVEDEMSLKDIGDELGAGKYTIRAWLEEHNIEIRDRYEKMVEQTRRGPVQLITDQDGYETWHGGTEDGHWSFGVHRLVAIAEYGVEQVREKVIHHKNEIPWDNRPQNLEPMSRADHLDHHVNSSMAGDQS